MKTKILILSFVSLLGGMALVYQFKKPSPNPTIQEDKKISYWTCSMHPQVHKDGPGSCPICGMALVPVYAEAGLQFTELTGIVISHEKEHLIGLETASVIQDNSPDNSILIPKSALVDTGDEKYVFVAGEDHRFIKRPVKTGDSTEDEIRVSEGLAPGEKIVIQGTFMVDAEYQLRKGK